VIGADADIAIWDPKREVTISAALLHDLAGYSPYEGRTVTGWPVTVLSRGRVVVDDGFLRAAPGSGRFLARDAGAAAAPTSRRGPEFDRQQNFGAKI
jgi:dihydropyrimidinase